MVGSIPTLPTRPFCKETQTGLFVRTSSLFSSTCETTFFFLQLFATHCTPVVQKWGLGMFGGNGNVGERVTACSIPLRLLPWVMIGQLQAKGNRVIGKFLSKGGHFWLALGG